jgi:hypothetical protein
MTTAPPAVPGQPGVPSSTVLDLYKLTVEMADRMSARRASANSFFVTIHSSLAAVVGVIGAVTQTKSKQPDELTFGMLAAVGFVLSITWWVLLRYYRRLNTAKFEVINAIEESLPIQPYTDEWKVLHPAEAVLQGATNRARLGQWVKKKRHSEASLVEQVIPLVFAAIYVVLGARVWL